MLLIFGVNNIYAQKKGKVEIIADPKINELVEKNIEFNKKIKTVSGYRVLIASLSGNSSKAAAFRTRDEFLLEYPDIGAYIIFEEPNFKVKVGDFKTRLEAFAFYQKVKDKYPATIIKDNVFFSKLEPENQNKEEFIEETESEEK